MKLIDANKLFLHFNDWQLAEAPKDKTGHEPIEYTGHEMQSMVYKTIGEAMRGIDEAPEVEAIPIEWINTYVKHNFRYQDEREPILQMLHDWRKQ